MNSRARVAAALAHQAPDRTPVFEYVFLSPLADRLLGRRYVADSANWDAAVSELGWEAAVRQKALDQLDLAVLLGHDMMYVTPHPGPPSTCGVPPPSWTAGPDPVENIAERNRQAEQDGPPDEHCLLVYSCLKDEMRRRDLDLPILAPAYHHGVWTDVDLMQTLLLAPDVARRHFALATRRALAWIEKYLALGIDQIGVGGDFSGTRPLISPDVYRSFIVPEVRALARRIHRDGARAVNASDGNLWPVIDDFLLGCEIDGYLEIDDHAGMDLRRLKAAYGTRVTFYGSLDCGTVLSFATPDEVRQHTTACLEAGLGHGGHILCASNAITASVPLTNYVAVVNAYRDFFGLRPFVPST
jgi:hypothetical protein